ncbi:MAG: hypothetical protein IRZ09_12040 [Variibacter sp.]|nr:hypothetical protein [Variibacter sp.]
MRISIAAAALSLALASGSALAQPRWYGVESYGALSPHYLMSVVRAAGLRPVSRPVRLGRTYVVHAVDSYGDTKRVVIDAEFGDIVRITSAARPGGPPYGYRWGPPRRWYDDDLAGPPPRGGRGSDPYDPFEWPGARIPDADEAREYHDYNARPVSPDERPARAKPHGTTQKREGSTAAANPAQRQQPPLPRSRPPAQQNAKAPAEASAPSQPNPPAQPSPQQPSAPQAGAAEAGAPAASGAPARPSAPSSPPKQAPAPQAASPRVILPGPTPKAEAAPEAGRKDGDPQAGSPAKPPEGGGVPALPPVQPLE